MIPDRQDRGRSGRRLRQLVLAVLAAANGGCAGLVQYTDEVRQTETGRSKFVTAPATLGGLTGFVVGVPVSIAAVPVTYAVYLYERGRAPLQADLAGTLLFPSFVLWRAGTLLLGGPFDALEFAVWRGWQDPVSLSDGEREQIERDYDRDVLPQYPVRTIYPSQRTVEAAHRSSGPRDTMSDRDSAPSFRPETPGPFDIVPGPASPPSSGRADDGSSGGECR